MKQLVRLGRHLMRSFGLVLVTTLLFFVLSNSTAAAQITKEVVEEQQETETGPRASDHSGDLRQALRPGPEERRQRRRGDCRGGSAA